MFVQYLIVALLVATAALFLILRKPASRKSAEPTCGQCCGCSHTQDPEAAKQPACSNSQL